MGNCIPCKSITNDSDNIYLNPPDSSWYFIEDDNRTIIVKNDKWNFSHHFVYPGNDAIRKSKTLYLNLPDLINPPFQEYFTTNSLHKCLSKNGFQMTRPKMKTLTMVVYNLRQSRAITFKIEIIPFTVGKMFVEELQKVIESKLETDFKFNFSLSLSLNTQELICTLLSSDFKVGFSFEKESFTLARDERIKTIPFKKIFNPGFMIPKMYQSMALKYQEDKKNDLEEISLSSDSSEDLDNTSIYETNQNYSKSLINLNYKSKNENVLNRKEALKHLLKYKQLITGGYTNRVIFHHYDTPLHKHLIAIRTEFANGLISICKTISPDVKKIYLSVSDKHQVATIQTHETSELVDSYFRLNM